MTIADAITVDLLARLAAIRQGNSVTLLTGGVYPYQTDAGQLVDLNLEYTEHPDDMPSLVLYPGTNTSSESGDVPPELGQENHTQEYSIEGFIEDDKAGTNGKLLANDIAAAVKSDPWFGDKVVQLNGFNTSTSTQVGDTVYSIARVGFSVLYAAPYGSE